MKKIPVGILGATGMVGQQYIQLLINHPQFEIAWLASSEKSAGKTYGQAVQGRWHMSEPLPAQIANMKVNNIENISSAVESCRFVFSALTTEAAKTFEEKYAAAGLPVISNASHHRATADVPMLIAEVNPEHCDIIPIQKKNRHWKDGFIAVKPNCSIQSYVIPLFPLHANFGLKKIIVTTLQAISGAGYPGVSSYDITDNVIPYIAKEEEKSECEPLKIFGRIDGSGIRLTESMTISAHCNRVPVIDGHMACVSVQFEKKPSQEQILHSWRQFQGEPQEHRLHSAPKHPIIYREEVDRPQPRIDRDAGKGMAVTVGRLRPCSIFDYRFVALSHNTIRGAAGGGVLNAELLLLRGHLGSS